VIQRGPHVVQLPTENAPMYPVPSLYFLRQRGYRRRLSARYLYDVSLVIFNLTGSNYPAMPTCPGPLTGSLTGPSIFANQQVSEPPSSSVINKQQTRHLCRPAAPVAYF
jgi:hypothetical protein